MMLSTLASLIDAAAWADVASTPAAVAAGARVVSLGGGTVVVYPALDHMMLNRAFLVPPSAMSEVARIYRAHGLSNWVAHVPAAGRQEAGRRADALGLEWFHRPWAKLARHRAGDPLPSGSGPLPIGPARPAEAEVLADLFCDGFDLPDAARPLIGALVGRPAWDVLVAREGDAVVGLGLAFDAHGGTALEGGVTAPAYRGQGIQGAIMAARVRRAFDRGSSWVSSETGVAVPGQPNSSWRNMERCGLRPLGEWHNLVPRGARWAA